MEFLEFGMAKDQGWTDHWMHLSMLMLLDDYMRKIKMERMESFPFSLPGMGPEEDLFSAFDMHPNEMEFDIFECSQERFMRYMEIVTSAPVEASIPGKQLLYLVKEKNSGQIFGMIRFGSPTINSKPRRGLYLSCLFQGCETPIKCDGEGHTPLRIFVSTIEVLADTSLHLEVLRLD